MGLLAKKNFKTYLNTWEEVSRESFDSDDMAIVESAEVVASNYGISAKLVYISGEVVFIPLSRDNQDMGIGQTIDLSKCFLVTLKRGTEYTEKLLVKE